MQLFTLRMLFEDQLQTFFFLLALNLIQALWCFLLQLSMLTQQNDAALVCESTECLLKPYWEYLLHSMILNYFFQAFHYKMLLPCSHYAINRAPFTGATITGIPIVSNGEHTFPTHIVKISKKVILRWKLTLTGFTSWSWLLDKGDQAQTDKSKTRAYQTVHIHFNSQCGWTRNTF